MLKQMQMGLRAFLVLASKVWTCICYLLKKQVRAVSNSCLLGEVCGCLFQLLRKFYSLPNFLSIAEENLTFSLLCISSSIIPTPVASSHFYMYVGGNFEFLEYAYQYDNCKSITISCAQFINCSAFFVFESVIQPDSIIIYAYSCSMHI